MSFLDNTGLAYFYSKLKNKFARSINKNVPNSNGNIDIINVATANNLTSPDNVITSNAFIYRTTGGDNTLISDEARLLSIEGNSVITGRVQESITAFVTRTRKNLIDDSKRYVASSTQVFIGAESNAYAVALSAGTYTISVDFSGETYGMYYRETNDDANRTLWSTSSGTTEKTFTIEEDGVFRFWVYRSTTSGGVDPTKIIYVQIELGSTATAYEPYNISGTDLNVSIDAATWRASGYGETSGNYNFNYLSNSNTWSPSIDSTGLTVTGIHASSISASFSGEITEVTVDKATWETQITTSGNYNFIYDGSNWKLGLTTVLLSNYGIAIVGSPTLNNVITIIYEAATPNSTVTVQYIKGERGTINIATPTSLISTGFNQYDKTSMVISNATITDNVIATESDSYICWCPAKGGVPNGYVAYSAYGAIEDIGWCSALPTIGMEVVTDSQTVLSSNLAAITFANDGYVVVAADISSELCIHPRWSGDADNIAGQYHEPSIIALPTVGTLNGLPGNTLPLAEYGMPSIGLVSDKLDLEKQIYIQNIGREDFTEINLAAIQALNVDYDYDDTNIFYVLPNPIIYKIESDMAYFVDDHGTEEFSGTDVPVNAEILYGESLRDKLRFNVELKKLTFDSITVTSNAFSSDATYAHYGYKVTIPLTGVNSTMMPQVILGVTEATTGVFAPISQTYDGGVYLYASKVLNSSFTIPLIICWQNYE